MKKCAFRGSFLAQVQSIGWTSWRRTAPATLPGIQFKGLTIKWRLNKCENVFESRLRR